MKKLNGKVVLITGAAGGLGRATAEAFAEQGASLSLCDLRAETLQEAASECGRLGAQVLQQACDVTNYGSLKSLVETTEQEFGRIDVLVNNAIATTQWVSIMDHTEEMWQAPMRSGLDAVWHLMRLCYPVMKRQGGGKVINLASTTGMQGTALFSAYVTAKEGVRALTRVAAREWGPDKITVNCIAPMCETELSTETIAKIPEELRALTMPPLGYMGDAKEDIAPVMVFLASDDSQYITGQTLCVDGGMEIHA